MNEAFKRMGLHIVGVYKYDSTRYLVRALHDPTRENELDTWYGYDSKSGSISTYSPIIDLKKFREVISGENLYEKVK